MKYVLDAFVAACWVLRNPLQRGVYANASYNYQDAAANTIASDAGGPGYSSSGTLTAIRDHLDLCIGLQQRVVSGDLRLQHRQWGGDAKQQQQRHDRELAQTGGVENFR